MRWEEILLKLKCVCSLLFQNGHHCKYKAALEDLQSDRAFLTGVGKEASERNLIQTPQCLYRAFKAYQLGYFSLEDYEADDPFCEFCSGCGRCESEVH